LVKPSDLSEATKVSPAPPVGEENVLKSRLDTLDQEMRRILEMPAKDLHLKIRLYLETLRQYIMSARQLDQSLQQQQQEISSSSSLSSAPLLLINRETQTIEGEGEEEEGIRKEIAKHRLVAHSSTPPAVKRQRQQQQQHVDDSSSSSSSSALGKEDFVTPVPPQPPPPLPPMVAATTSTTAAEKPTPAAAAASERKIRPMRLSFYDVADQAKDPYSVESLVHLMPDSRKEEARKLLKNIENSKTMRWDPATGIVYQNEKPISSANLIDAFLQKRFSTTSQSKGPMTGYEEFKNALQHTRAVGGQKGEGPI
jgi:hypothetical protein